MASAAAGTFSASGGPLVLGSPGGGPTPRGAAAEFALPAAVPASGVTLPATPRTRSSALGRAGIATISTAGTATGECAKAKAPAALDNLPSESVSGPKRELVSKLSDLDAGGPAGQVASPLGSQRVSPVSPDSAANDSGVSPRSPNAPRSQRTASTEAPGVPKPKFDVCTLRQWWNNMDASCSGHVTKNEWLAFLGNNPKLKNLIISGTVEPQKGDRFSDESIKRIQEDAREVRKLTQKWKEIDLDKSGTMEWEEFVEYFRTMGSLQEYEDPNHPKVRLAQLLQVMHECPTEMNEEMYAEFAKLKNKHMGGGRRRSLEEDALRVLNQSEPAPDPGAMRSRRHSIGCSDTAPELVPNTISPQGGAKMMARRLSAEMQRPPGCAASG